MLTLPERYSTILPRFTRLSPNACGQTSGAADRAILAPDSEP